MTENTTDAPFTVTIKADGGYDAPWLVVRGDSAHQVMNRLTEASSPGPDGYSLNDLITQVAIALSKSYRAEKGGATGPVQRVEQAVSADPAQTQAYASTAQVGGAQQAQQAAAPGPSCQHGPRVHRTGSSAKGPWSAWFCPTPKGTPDQCAPVWDKR